MSTEPTASGRCLCGAVAFEVSGELRPVIYCHCEQCRRSSGHYVAATACRCEELHIEGEESVSWYRSSPSAERGFCARCGSGLFWRPAHGEYMGIWAGTIDTPNELRAARHIFVDNKPDYYRIDDDLPQFAEDYPSFFDDNTN